jgi:hypothetical protein
MFMSQNKWNELPYDRVPSVAMKRYKALFLEYVTPSLLLSSFFVHSRSLVNGVIRHDKIRFAEYIYAKRIDATSKVRNAHFVCLFVCSKSLQQKLASGALLPHQILAEAQKTRDETLSDVVQLQWQSYVENIKAKGRLSNIMPVSSPLLSAFFPLYVCFDCLYVCDVSGSMASPADSSGKVTNLHVSTALSILISEIAAPPFANLICTFSEKPEFRMSLRIPPVLFLSSSHASLMVFFEDVVTGSTLKEKYNNLVKAKWMMNTNFQAVFELILAQAQRHNLTNDQMVKK